MIENLILESDFETYVIGPNMNFEISRSAKEKCNNVILLTGCARSGTTIMGKIIHSFQDVEYDYLWGMDLNVLVSD